MGGSAVKNPPILSTSWLWRPWSHDTNEPDGISGTAMSTCFYSHFRCPMATPRQMVGSGTMAGRGGMTTTAELTTKGIFYFSCPTFGLVTLIVEFLGDIFFRHPNHTSEIPGMISTGGGVEEAQVRGNKLFT